MSVESTSDDNIERFSSTPTIVGVMDDQTPIKPDEAANQAENADQELTVIAKSLDQTQVNRIESHERFYNGHVELAAADQKQAASVKGLKDVAMKHHETVVC